MRDQKRWMKNWIRALAVGTMITAAVPISVMAAEKGWVNEDGAAHYVDSNGSYVKNQWKTSQGVSYYLDENGDLAKNVWVDGTYYAGEDGSMTKDAWIYVDENDGSMKSGWYYLNRNGKVEKNDWKTIGKGKYCFDSDGRMRTGWHYENGDIYYLGNGSEGYTRSGWYFLESDGKKRPAEGSVSKDLSGESENGRWYYFQSNGKARKGENGAPKETTIDGKKYYFDTSGVMLANTIASIDGTTYRFDSDGAATKTSDNDYTVEGKYVKVFDAKNNKYYYMEEEFLEHPGIADGKVSDLDLLAAVCDAEAGDQGVVGMEAVALCVLNCTIDQYKEFPSQIRYVVYQGKPTQTEHFLKD